MGPKFAASATFEIGSPRIFGVMRSAIAENQATFMCYKLINTAFDGCNYFYSIVEGLKKSEPPGILITGALRKPL